ncbi:MAG TPA: hypothetical protein H9919_05930 [Candidatus Alistipes excrementipullorum]|nr:hypothetical protein [Candidatus Alistipes excrementipullorum]
MAPVTSWQDIAVAVIGAAIAVHAVYRIVRSIKARKEFNPCDSCPQAGCPSRNKDKQCNDTAKPDADK